MTNTRGLIATDAPTSASLSRRSFKLLSQFALWAARVGCSFLFIAAMLWPLPTLVQFFDEGWSYKSAVLMNAPPWLICVPLLYLLVLGAASWLLQASWQRPLGNVLFLAWFFPIGLAFIAAIEHRDLWLMLNASQIQSTRVHQSLVLKHYFIPKASTSATRYRNSFQENWVEVSHPLDPQLTLRLESYMVGRASTNPGTALCVPVYTGRFGLQWVADVSPCKPGHTMKPLSSAGLVLTRPVLRTHQTGRLEVLAVDGSPSTSTIDATDPQPPSLGPVEADDWQLAAKAKHAPVSFFQSRHYAGAMVLRHQTGVWYHLAPFWLPPDPNLPSDELAIPPKPVWLRFDEVKARLSSDGARLVACRAGEGLLPERCVVLQMPWVEASKAPPSERSPASISAPAPKP